MSSFGRLLSEEFEADKPATSPSSAQGQKQPHTEAGPVPLSRVKLDKEKDARGAVSKSDTVGKRSKGSVAGAGG